jgi:hypothetical protein
MLLLRLVDNLVGIDHGAVVRENLYMQLHPFNLLFNSCLEKRILPHLSPLQGSLPLIGISFLWVKLYLKCRILGNGLGFCQFKVRYIS